MTEQPTLFTPPAATGKLTDRQLAAYEFVRDHPDGVSVDELGAFLHHRRGRHGPDMRCRWCSSEGQSVLLSLRSEKRGRLVKRRRADGMWTLSGREASRPVSAPDPAEEEIPF